MSRWVRGIGTVIVAFFAIWLVTLPLIIYLADSSIAHKSQAPEPTTSRTADARTVPPTSRTSDPPTATPRATTTTAPTSDEGPILFGIGGEGCDLSLVGRTFTPGSRIRFVTETPPGASASVTIELHARDQGANVDGYPQRPPTSRDTRCVSAALPMLTVGSYEVLVRAGDKRFVGTFSIAP